MRLPIWYQLNISLHAVVLQFNQSRSYKPHMKRNCCEYKQTQVQAFAHELVC